MATKKLDLVLVGATGFTGKLAALYCAEAYGSKISWGICGRDVRKLEALREEIEKAKNLEADTIKVIVADNTDRDAIAAMVKNTHVVVSFAGPFWKYGTILVEECVKAGVHYCDITGESPWVREIIDQLHEDARKTGAKIVPFCGLDSVPSEIGALLAATEMRRRYDCGCRDITLYVGPSKGGVSGGTIASMFNLLDRPWPQLRRLLTQLGNPYYLNPSEVGGPSVPANMGVWYSRDAGMFTAPWIMARVNGHVVRRSNALLGSRYGANMKYGEVTAHKRTVVGFLCAVFIAAVSLILSLVLLIKPIRNFIAAFLPKPGEGPSEEQRKKGFFRWYTIATGDRSDSPKVRVALEGNVDPGYTGAALMAIESAMCIVQEESALPKQGGVLTPASAFGDTLVQRLNKAGLKFEVTNNEKKK